MPAGIPLTKNATKKVAESLMNNKLVIPTTMHIADAISRSKEVISRFNTTTMETIENKAYIHTPGLRKGWTDCPPSNRGAMIAKL
jgi:hypothetical protein